MKGSIIIAGLLVAAGSAVADINVTQDNNALNLANAIFSDPLITVNSASLFSHNNGVASSSGLYSLDNNPDTYGLRRDGAILSSGDVSDYETGPDLFENNSTDFGYFETDAGRQARLEAISGPSSYYDTTELTVNFTPDAFATDNTLAFEVVFGSDEWSEYAFTTFIDAFGIFVNGVNYAFENGAPININNPGMATIGGTELDGVLTNVNTGDIVVRFAIPIDVGVANQVTFTLADRGDTVYDTTAYISGVRLVPGAGTAALVGVAGLAGLRRRRA